MLISETVEVGLNSKTAKYYESIGYEIPKTKVRNKYVVKHGTTIAVKVKDLLSMSNIMVIYQCDYCGSYIEVMYCDYMRKNSNKKIQKDSCLSCLGLYKSELNKLDWEEKYQSNNKVCSKCKRDLPKTLEYFQKNRHRPDGLSCQCKECISSKKIFGIKKITVKQKEVKISKSDNIKYITINGFKICRGCERNLPANIDYYYKKHDTKDGFMNRCKECEGGKFTKKLIHIPQDGFKFCIKCDRELPIDIKYFPPDKMCKDGLRNVCRECGKDGHFMEDGYEPNIYWTDRDNVIFIKRYSLYTCEELKNKFYSTLTTKQIWNHAYILRQTTEFDLYKTDTVKERANAQRSIKMSGENCPWYGKPMSEETKKKLSESKKGKYVGENNALYGVKWDKNDKRRFLISERTKGKWSGNKNPRVSNPLRGKENPNWKGGITPLYFELRSEIRQWQILSMQNCKYKCILTGGKFDNVHHLHPFRKIVDELFEILDLDIRTQVADYSENEFNLIRDTLFDLHMKYPLGVCLRKDVHKLFHDIYGYTNNTPEQFYEFAIKFDDGEFTEILKEVG